MRISLTFDNGPIQAVTPNVLDTLDQRGVAASFFVIGSQITDRGNREIVREAKAAGHRIGNHTFTHSLLLGVTKDQVGAVREISDTQELLGELGVERLFRPYGGDVLLDHRVMSTTAYDYLRANAYTCVLWNCIPRDWEHPVDWVERALAEIRVNPWAVVVVHDLPTGAMAQLGTFIDQVRDMGAEFVSDFPTSVTPLIAGKEVWDIKSRGMLSAL